MRLPRLLPALAAGLVLLAAGCDSSDPAPTAPAVVAPAAFAFDDSFPESTSAHATTRVNWTNAALRVGVVSLAVGAHLVIPAAATNAAVQAEPRVEDGTWIWENTVPVSGTSVTFRLEGTPEGQEVAWRMLISSAGPIGGVVYDDFALYTGTTTLNGRAGDWQLYYLIEGERTQVLTADFEITSEAVREVTFLVPETNPNEEARGSTVRYARDGAARLFDWHQEPEDFDHLVEWSAATHAGAITATNFNGGARACWDAHLEDVACAP